MEGVLSEFNGTILLVSHDRYLIRALATQISELEDGRLQVYRGSYDEYLKEKRRRQGDSQPESAQRQKRRRPAEREARESQREQERRALRAGELETEIAVLENQLTTLTAALAKASAAQQLDRVRELGVEYGQTEQTLEGLMVEWEAIAEAVRA